MKNLLANKNILVVGAGGLLGSRVAAAALAQGAKVIAADMNVEKMETLFKNLDINTKVLFNHLDLSDKESIEKLLFSNNQLDGAVNCTYPRNKTYGAHFFDVTLKSFNENVSLHLGSAFLFSQQCAAYFKKYQRPFSLVNISSIYGSIVPDFCIYENTKMTMPVEYAAIKSAILHLSKYISAYVDDSGFRINCVSPGGIVDNQPQEFLKAYKSKTHGTGMLDPECMVGAVLFLLSNQSKYMVGQNLTVDDGFSL